MRMPIHRRAGIFLGVFLLTVLCSPAGRATTFTVSNTMDAGAGSLRMAILDANVDATATAMAPHFIDAAGISGTITLASDLPAIANHVILSGPSSLDLIVDGSGSFLPFRVMGAGVLEVTLDHLIIQNGTSADGGAVVNDETLTLDHCWIRGNSTPGRGGGVLSLFSAELTMINCVVTGNSSSNAGGGIWANGPLIVINCTIAGNNSSTEGGAVSVQFGMSPPTVIGNFFTLANSIFALNTAPSNPEIMLQGAPPVATLGGNLISDNSGIGGFAIPGTPNGNGDYIGMPGSTIDPMFVVNVPAAPSIGGNVRLLFGSVAIDNGVNANVGSNMTDLDDRPRIFSGVDIGAYEFGSTSCRIGNVNTLFGDPVNVLLVNGSAGTGFERRVTLSRNTPLTLSMDAPPSMASAAFVAYVFAGEPFVSNERVLPMGVGTFCMPIPLTDSSPPPFLAPLEIFNNLGLTGMLGVATRPSSPAPSDLVTLDQGARRGLTVFIQALIQDTDSPQGQVAVSNGILLDIP